MGESQAWRWMSDRQRWRAVSITFVLLFCGASLWLYAAGGGFIPLPKTYDSRLVGNWKSEQVSGGEVVRRTCVFRMDGTGEAFLSDRLICPFRWGTEDGVLYLK